MDEDDSSSVYREAVELLVLFKQNKMQLLNHHENIQIMLAKNNTEIRDVDKNISETEILIKKL